ncbi:MAG TPA: biopolymer transporter ExbD, partial [Planctomycetota bacterium]|nr:biopolymer transporter ExbD [Planctomycetota bacterium]
DVNRPQAQTGSLQKGDVFLIGVSSAGTIHINHRRVELTAVRQLVANRRPGSGVVVVADERSTAGLLVRVVDQCRLAGAKDVAVATRAGGIASTATVGGAP